MQAEPPFARELIQACHLATDRRAISFFYAIEQGDKLFFDLRFHGEIERQLVILCQPVRFLLRR